MKERLKELINVRLGITQAEFADAVGITQAAISQYLSGSREPSAKILTQISKIYHVSTDWLLGVTSKNSVNLTALGNFYCKHCDKKYRLLGIEK